MDWPYIGGPDRTQNGTAPDTTIEPGEITAGDSIYFTRSLDSYRASDGWVLSYTGRSGASSFTFSSTTAPNGLDHVLSVTAATTALWPAGTYIVQGYATNAGLSKRQTIYSGHLIVGVNLATSTETDFRTHAQKMLDAINLALETAGTSDVISYSVEGISMTVESKSVLIQQKNYYQGLINAEQAALAAKAGKASGRTVLSRFVRR